MKSIEIIIKFIAPKINNSEEIFTKLELFKEVVYWLREANRERIAKHSTQYDLARKIDDIGSEVDKYLEKVRFKMLKNGKAGKNSLSNKLYDTEQTIKWLAARWGNVFLNIATNPKYKSYIDASSIGYELNDNVSHTEDALLIIIKEEEEKEFKQKRKNEIELWHQDWAEMLSNGKIGGEPTEYGHTQMVLIF